MRKALNELVIEKKHSIESAVQKMTDSGSSYLFVVDEKKKLVGLLTDGDLRRALLKRVSLQTELHEIMQKSFTSAHVDDEREKVFSLFSDKISFIPLIDENGILVDFVTRDRNRSFPLAEPLLNGNELQYVTECVSSGWISSQGNFVKKFEEMFAEIHGISSQQVVAVSNGTTALHLAIASLGIGKGDEVIVPDFTFAASANAVAHAGATPILVDVESETWCICPEAFEKAITPRTKAVMPVHLYGHPAKMDEILAIAKKHNLYVIEDCAESLGARYNKKLTGVLGDAGTFSFFGNKTITTGEGGMVTFKNVATANRARMLRDHGMSKEKRYWHLEVGFNYRMTNLQAAIGVAQLERFQEILKKKAEIGRIYRSIFEGMWQLELPPNLAPSDPTCWIFTLMISKKCEFKREKLMDALLRKGIETRATFFPLHEMPAFEEYLTKDRSFKNSKDFSERGISLPSSVTLSESDVRQIGSAVKSVIEMHAPLKK
jgi:perosamine synthetase